MRSVFPAYIAEEPELLSCFAAPPRALLENAPTVAPWAGGLADALTQYQTELGGSASFQGNEAVVVTGQQAGIFTGPLYTIYKAVTAIVLARTVRENFDTPCTPVFWVGSEDHDFEEVRTAHFLTRNHEPLSLEYGLAQDVDGFPMHRVPLDASLHALVDEASEETAGSEFREDVTAFLHESLDASASLSDWMARLMARLFRDTPLVIFSPHLHAARRASVEILEQEIREPLRSTALLNEAGTRLERLGFSAQVTKGDTECGFFVEVGERRRKVLYERSQFQLPDEEMSFSEAELLAILGASPERFSPNVALRCVVQQHLFPAAAYVAGPGEVAYWAQLKPLFEHFGKPMPVVYPRARCALTNLKLNKLSTKLGLGLGDLEGPMDEVVERAVGHGTANPAYRFVQAERGAVEGAMQDLAEGLTEHDATAASMAEGLAQETASKLDRLERSILQGEVAKNEAARKQVQRLCNSLAPWRKPQERVYNVFSFLFEHGWGLIPRLIEEIDVESFAMQEIEL